VTRVAGPGPGTTEVVVTHLEMTDPGRLRAGREPIEDAPDTLRPAPDRELPSGMERRAS